MQDALVDLIRSDRHGDRYCKERMFHDSFQRGEDWIEYLHGRFGDGGEFRVEKILDKPGSTWTPEDFHALYIACWIFEPVAKGTFMIKLSDAQAAQARQGYDLLGKIELKALGDERNYTGKRWTSHLSEKGRSARRGWRFLKGYHELLVQLEQGAGGSGTHLFLKAEGHASHEIEHLKSFKTKLMTGSGETANAFLEGVAKSRQELGISSRAAENFSNKYGKLLKHLGLRGKKVSAVQAITCMYAKLESCLQPGSEGHLDAARQAAGLPSKLPADAMSNGQLGRLLKEVIVPMSSSTTGGGLREKVKAKLGGKAAKFVPLKYADFSKCIEDAAADLDKLAQKLASDQASNAFGQRYFHEVVLLPRQINQGLMAFKTVFHDYIGLAALGY